MIKNFFQFRMFFGKCGFKRRNIRIRQGLKKSRKGHRDDVGSGGRVLAAIDQDTDPGIGQQIFKFLGLPGGDQIKRAQIVRSANRSSANNRVFPPLRYIKHRGRFHVESFQFLLTCYHLSDNHRKQIA